VRFVTGSDCCSKWSIAFCKQHKQILIGIDSEIESNHNIFQHHALYCSMSQGTTPVMVSFTADSVANILTNNHLTSLTHIQILAPTVEVTALSLMCVR